MSNDPQNIHLQTQSPVEKNQSETKHDALLMQALIENDWKDKDSSYDWYLGMMLGTDEYLNTNEKNILTEKCNQIILDHLLTLDKTRLQHMANKARTKNNSFMEVFGKNAFGRRRLYNYNDDIVKGEITKEVREVENTPLFRETTKII